MGDTGENTIGRIAEPEEIGLYQARVVVIALAAELALKFSYEQENPSEVAPATHDLRDLFAELSDDKVKAVRKVYARLLNQYKHQLEQDKKEYLEDGWETADHLFENCRYAFEDWRYIEERMPRTPFVMRATLLELGARSVLEGVRESLR